jgi:hypothetical protein
MIAVFVVVVVVVERVLLQLTTTTTTTGSDFFHLPSPPPHTPLLSIRRLPLLLPNAMTERTGALGSEDYARDFELSDVRG